MLKRFQTVARFKCAASTKKMILKPIPLDPYMVPYPKEPLQDGCLLLLHELTPRQKINFSEYINAPGKSELCKTKSGWPYKKYPKYNAMYAGMKFKWFISSDYCNALARCNSRPAIRINHITLFAIEEVEIINDPKEIIKAIAQQGVLSNTSEGTVAGNVPAGAR